MNITCLIPPSEDKIPERIYGCSYQLYPQPDLPLLYVAGSLQESGHALSLRDFTFEDNCWKSFEEFVSSSESDAYIIHSVLLSKRIDTKAYRVIRSHHPDAFVIFFGPEPTRVPADFLLDERCFVVRGEPEIICKDLINCLENDLPLHEIKGISYVDQHGKPKNNETFGIIEDLDALPFPARNLTKKYEDKFYNTKIPGRPFTLMLTSRGCPFRCYFCVPNSISWARELEWRRFHDNQKPPLKVRSAQNVIEELEQLGREGYKSIWMMDDMFLWHRPRILEILEGAKRLSIEFGILARVDFIDEEISRNLKEAGCKIVALGVESFQQEILDYIKKDLRADKILPAIEALKKAGVSPEINLMMGVCPLETKASIKHSIRQAIKLDVKYVLFSIGTPFPGTELERIAFQKGWIVEEKYQNLLENLDPANHALLRFPNLSEKDLEYLERYAKMRFYFRPGYIWWQLKKIRSFSEFWMLIKTALKILKYD